MITRGLIWVAIALLTTSCSFHLRGLVDMPSWLDNVAIIIENAHRDLDPAIKEQLQTYNIKVAPNATEATYLLVIEKDSVQQQITNVTASTATRQYQLIYDVQFTLIKAKGDLVIPSSHVIVTRRFTMDNNRVLGSNWIETLLNNEMRRDAAAQIIYKMSRKEVLPDASSTRQPVPRSSGVFEE